ncbi:MAG: hypothetical protein KDK89_10240 [Alphaproteobacteria bacterium]|nr:hypothetical protein [Alphaproteobacteria bacterium]
MSLSLDMESAFIFKQLLHSQLLAPQEVCHPVQPLHAAIEITRQKTTPTKLIKTTTIHLNHLRNDSVPNDPSSADARSASLAEKSRMLSDTSDLRGSTPVLLGETDLHFGVMARGGKSIRVGRFGSTF